MVPTISTGQTGLMIATSVCDRLRRDVGYFVRICVGNACKIIIFARASLKGDIVCFSIGIRITASLLV